MLDINSRHLLINSQRYNGGTYLRADVISPSSRGTAQVVEDLPMGRCVQYFLLLLWTLLTTAMGTSYYCYGHFLLLLWALLTDAMGTSY